MSICAGVLLILVIGSTVSTVKRVKHDAASKIVVEQAAPRKTCAKACWCDVNPKGED